MTPSFSQQSGRTLKLWSGGFQPDLFHPRKIAGTSEGNSQSDFGFILDVLSFRHRAHPLAAHDYSGIIQLLTNLRLLDYAITVNVDPLPITRIMGRKEHDRGGNASERKFSLRLRDG